MGKRHARILVVALFATANLSWPGTSSAQIFDACTTEASLVPPAPFGHEVLGSASHTCANEHFTIAVVGCLLLNGVPVKCAEDNRANSDSASVQLAFPCVPGTWTTVAIGMGADRALPTLDADGPEVITECDPLEAGRP